MRRVVVVGGGVSGLATAWHLSRAEPGVSVTVLEGGPQLGGWISTVDIGALTGRPRQPVDVGPDSLLVRDPAVNALVSELGLDDARRSPGEGGAYIWVRSGLHRLPRSSVFGVPDSPLRLARSGLVGPLGMVRAAADLVLPRSRLGDDPSIAELLRPRLGGEVFANLVEPLLGGVHAGRADRLSARSAVPDVAAVAGRHRSLLRAVRGLEPRTGAGPSLIGLDGGMTRLVEALRSGAEQAGAQVLTGRQVERIERVEPVGPVGPVEGAGKAGDTRAAGEDGGGYRVVTADSERFPADQVVLAVPARVACNLLAAAAPAAADAAAQIEYAGVASITLAYDPAVFTGSAALPAGTGFLVPPSQGRLLVGCTWVTSKWPQPPQARTVVLRAMVGRDGDQRWAGLDDAELERAVRAELSVAMGLPADARPLAAVVTRMPGALPQYTVGHSRRLATIEAALGELPGPVGPDGASRLPGVVVTGAGYRGLGLAACLVSAEQAAASLLTPSPGL